MWQEEKSRMSRPKRRRLLKRRLPSLLLLLLSIGCSPTTFAFVVLEVPSPTKTCAGLQCGFPSSSILQVSSKSSSTMNKEDEDDVYDDGDDDDDDELGDYSMFGGFDGDFMSEGPDAYLTDNDLSLLYNISIPNLDDVGDLVVDDSRSTSRESLSSTSTTSNNSTTNTPRLSLQELKEVSSSGLSYFYLRDEIGLTEDEVLATGTVLGFKASTVKDKIDLLQSELDITKDQIRQLIASQPSLLHLSAKHNIKPTIDFLFEQLRLSKRDLRTLILGCPSLLTYSITNLDSKINFFLKIMKYNIEACRTILLEEPSIMTCSTTTGLIPRIEFLLNEIEIPMPKLRKIISKNPKILKMSIDDNLQPKLIFYFIMTLFMDPKQVQKLLVKNPTILNYNLEGHILPITRYFLGSLDVAAYEFAKMLLKFPSILAYGLPKIKHVVGYLRYELSLEDDDVRRVLYNAPQVISLDMENNLKLKIDYLKSILDDDVTEDGCNGITTTKRAAADTTDIDAMLRKVIVGMPTLLYLNIEDNLDPKVSYLKENLGGQNHLRGALLKMPALLAYSLENRIMPRMEQILDRGIDPSSISIGISMKQEAFDKWLNGRAEREATTTTTKPQSQDFIIVDKEKDKSKDQSTTRDVDVELLDDDETKKKKNKVVQDGGRIVHWVRRG